MLERPASATSWGLGCIQKFTKFQGVIRVNFDFCTMEMKSKDDHSKVPATKVLEYSQIL